MTAAILLAATLVCHAPLVMPGLPDSVTYGERPMRLELHRWRQSPTWVCCLRHESPPEWWALVWPIVRREAWSTAVWTRPAAPGERIVFGGPCLACEGLPSGSYRVRACQDGRNGALDTCSAFGRWVTLP